MSNRPLEAAIRNCSLHALLLLVLRTLTRLGYGDVEILDRRTSGEKSRHGGHELMCEARFGAQPIRIVVKVVRDSVRIRHLDELAGTVIRMGADSGMIVSPFRLTKRARTLLASYGPVRVRVVEGEQLAAWLAELRIGTRGVSDVDYAFFGNLEEHSANVLSLLRRIGQ